MPRYKALKRRSMRVYGRMRLVAPGEIVELDAEQVKGFEDCFEAVPEEAPQATEGGASPTAPPSATEEEPPPSGRRR
jgi:hypothetical protein